MLRLVRQKDESWLQAALRVAAPQHLEDEVKEAYERGRRSGDSEMAAAWAACYEYNLLETVNETYKV